VQAYGAPSPGLHPGTTAETGDDRSGTVGTGMEDLSTGPPFGEPREFHPTHPGDLATADPDHQTELAASEEDAPRTPTASR